MMFRHPGWATAESTPTVVLRQGCSVSPMLFCRCMEDMFASVQQEGAVRGCGLQIGTHIC